MPAVAEKVFVRHDPCPKCGSKDNLAVYDDGSAKCFGQGCKHKVRKGTLDTAPAVDDPGTNEDLIEYVPQSIPGRHLSAETCKLWSYGMGTIGGEACHVATYRDKDGRPIAQKLRLAGKKFRWVGDHKAVTLYGQSLWPTSGRRVIVVEGELDALSVSQAQGNKWPVVSIPDGAGSALKACKASLEWLSGYAEVVLMLDNDEAGQAATVKVAELLPPGVARVASLPLKDASDMLVAGRGDELVRAAWNARVWRPDGIVSGKGLWDRIAAREEYHKVDYPFPTLNAQLRGLRTSELITFCAGSSIGKSQVCREVAYNLVQAGEKLAYIALEESVEDSALGLLGIKVGKPLYALKECSFEEMKAFESAWKELENQVEFYDHFGSIEVGAIAAKIRYLAKSLDCRWVVLDHVSIMVSGNEETDDRKNLDITMTRLRALAQELKIGILIVSHLKRPAGKGHEEGARTSLSDLRGSHSIAQLSNVVVGLERNLQDEEHKHYTQVRVLKDRWRGATGPAGVLKYDVDTGRITEALGFDLDGSGALVDGEDDL